MDDNTDFQSNSTGNRPTFSSSHDDDLITNQIQPNNIVIGNTGAMVADEGGGYNELDLTNSQQSGNNSSQDDDQNDDKTDLDGDGIEDLTTYSDNTMDEKDLQRAGDDKTMFRGLVQEEAVTSKTPIRQSDKDSITYGLAPDNSDDTEDIEERNEDKTTSLVVDTSIDSQGLDNTDYGLNFHAPDTGDDTTGRLDAQGDDLENYDDAET